uniref:Uncharacterized protein n=1 Tax=Anguilla anguilla TaxID=7936 RepID=A0A0E9VV76_ANGAN
MYILKAMSMMLCLLLFIVNEQVVCMKRWLDMVLNVTFSKVINTPDNPRNQKH